MGRPKRWHLFLIVGALVLTIYNILPTLFFYTKPLQSAIDSKQAEAIALNIAKRVNSLEDESIAWVHSFAKLIGVKPLSVQIDETYPQKLQVKFTDLGQAQKFRRYLPRAGNLIATPSAQLQLYDQDASNKTVLVERRIPIHFAPAEMSSYFHYGDMKDSEGNPTEFYRNLVDDRVALLGATLGGSSEQCKQIQIALSQPQDPVSQEMLLQVCQELIQNSKVFEPAPSIRNRYFASFVQNENIEGGVFVSSWISALENLKDQTRLQRIALNNPQNPIDNQKIEFLAKREDLLSETISLLRKHLGEFSNSRASLNFSEMASMVQKSPFALKQTISLDHSNPFVESFTIDWDAGTLTLNLYSDLKKLRQDLEGLAREHLDQLLFNQLAALSNQSGELIKPFADAFIVEIKTLPDAQSFLALKLYNIARLETETLREIVANHWTPHHPDLQRAVFPVWDYATYEKLPASEKKLGLLIFSPSTLSSQTPPKGFKQNSIYVVVKGASALFRRYESEETEGAKQFLRDFNDLYALLKKSGFIGYSAASYPIASEFKSDYLFEHEDYYQNVLNASRENFSVHGTKRYALLELSSLEQRILTENKIDDQIHEDLLRWRDDYRAAQVDLKETKKFDIPKPTKNALWSNFKLSFTKYFRGDMRKVIRWGLDLSGGKTVQLQLRDENNTPVSNESDLLQGIKELHERVNKMGIAEVSIRKEGNSIALDFPGSQSLSAAELVKASSMLFHVVNEKFMINPTLSEATHQFLQEVWNEAVVTGKKESEQIHAIACRHLYGESQENPLPRTPSAKTLYENGLRLGVDSGANSDLDETFCKIALYRGSDYTQWHGQTHPLLIVFKNYALEGSSLQDIRGSYDPTKGNFLAFRVKGAPAKDALEAWSSQFSKEKIAGTPLEPFSRGRGWRMAVILNGSVITSPTLDGALRDSASISGSFTQRELNRLESDLKAGSLSFTPHILSEKNVSPELGGKERLCGIIAMFVALSLAIGAMIAYYRFGGLIASIAVLLNLLILWATLQNLGATLTLAGIAGIILTVAMAVDANVLVFERIREEFALSGRIASAVAAGYRKAFSAIIDSNITTMIAALILLNFDAGPIRGFAITLIIGIVSSLFTSLFITRTFFNWWTLNPQHKELKMSNLIRSTHFNFLKFTRPTVIVSALIILVGSFFLISREKTVLGMDFTGGYALTVDLPPSPQHNYRASVEEALVRQGLSSQDFQIRELNPSNQVRIFLSSGLEQKGKPFYDLPQTSSVGGYPFEGNAKIVWIVDALQQAHISLSPEALQNLEEHWTAISGQMSKAMQTSAFIGTAIALLCILAYITLRFEFKYALSATLCLAHDVIFCLGAIALLNTLGVPVQIDLHTIAALMTIVGYSLNDTIIVFDRIREEMRMAQKRSLSEIINHALNVTLSRTLMTSGITLLVLIPLIFLGGSTLFGFALVMVIGVFFGTLSSLFIAAPLMQFFHNRQLAKLKGQTGGS